MPLEKHIFQTGMDSDSSNETIIPTSYRYALNIRANSPDGANEGAITNVLGNTLVSFQLPVGNNKVIGSYEYKLYNKIYYFIYNTLSNHSILEYDASVNVVSTILTNPVLNLNLSFLITGINVIELDINNHLLYWTDNNEEPKKINIEKGKYFTSTGGNPANSPLGYISPFVADYLYRIKAPDLHPPSCAYGNDSTVDINLLQNQLFQFKSQFIYDDYEQSATSPISVVPFPTLTCSQNPLPTQNNFISITVETGTPIVTKINILGRIGNTGDFYLITTLDKSSLNIPSNSTTTYNYYNNGNYNAIEINTSIKLFDNVPIKSKSQEIIEGERIVDGDVVQGYDNVLINAELNLAFQPTPKNNLYSIQGNIRISNPNPSQSDYQNFQPIWTLNGTDTVFGGMDTSANGYVSGVGGSYQQILPLNGFVVYLAGTNYYAISKQIQNSSQGTQLSNGVYDGSSASKRDGIRDAITHQNTYSQFTINNVPPGTYLLRVASHLLTQSDLGGDINIWQKTSTFANGVGGTIYKECIVTITASSVSVGDTIIQDLTDPRLGYGSTGIAGYVVDIDTQPALTGTARLQDNRIDLAQVNIFNSAVLAGNPYTDHNGFFFFSSTALGGGVTLLLANVFVNSVVQSSLNKTKLDGSTWSNPSGAETFIGIFQNNSLNYFQNVRTIIEGTSNYQGSPLSGVSVILGRGQFSTTDQNGEYEIVAYGDTYNYLNNGFSPMRNDSIYYSLSDNCVGTFQFPYLHPYPAGINIGVYTYESPYTSLPQSNPYIMPIAIVALSIIGNTSTASLKRGSVYQFGIVYYDHANRSGLTNTNEKPFQYVLPNRNTIQIYGNTLVIPFFTQIANPNTSNNGEPIVSWDIWSQPPIWAKSYQWVRTLNGTLTDYLQFTAKSVVYTDNYRIIVPYSQATLIGINIQNIANYANMHGDSVLNFGTSGTSVNYIPDIGDRIRLISPASGGFFNTYVDLKIVNVDPAGIIYVENVFSIGQLTSGFLFEVYTPKLQTPTTQNSSQIYYEFGECYDIGNPGTTNRYHKGQSQDQSIPILNGLLSTIPASGTFSGGDTYSRIRNIPYGDTNPSDPSKSTSIKAWYIEDENFSDFFSSKVSDIGRPNYVNPTYKQVREKGTIYFSELFIPETQINGLSSVFDVSFQSYNLNYGSITKLFFIQRWLDVYQELKIGRIPINQAQIQSSSNIGGSNIVGQSANVLNPIIYYEGEFGCQNPESFANYGIDRYFFDLKRGAVLRLSTDGLFPISTYKMKNYFSTISKQIISNNITPQIYGTFDVRFREYVLSIITNTLINVNGIFILIDTTLAFNEKYNLWSTFYSYLPENLCTNGVDIVSFQNGAIYIHNSNATRNNFYGMQYSSEVDVIINAQPSKEKILAAISEECPVIWTSPSITTPNGQASNLIASDFETKQNLQYAAVLRDINTPNITNPLIEGDILVDTSFLVKLINNLITEVKMFAVNGYIQWQERSNK